MLVHMQQLKKFLENIIANEKRIGLSFNQNGFQFNNCFVLEGISFDSECLSLWTDSFDVHIDLCDDVIIGCEKTVNDFGCYYIKKDETELFIEEI